MLRILAFSLLLFLPAAPLRAAPLPEDPALDRLVTLTLNDMASRVLAELSKLSGVPLAADEHIDSMAVFVCVRDAPLRHVLAAMASPGLLEWRKEEGGAYRLCGPAVLPPPIDTRRLVEALLIACPGELHPSTDPTPPRPEDAYLPAPMGEVYASLRGPLLEAIEEGDEVPFAQLPATARRLIRDYLRESARWELRSILYTNWAVPPDKLAIHVGDRWWSIRVRKPEPPADAGAAPAPASSSATDLWESVNAPVAYQPVLPRTSTDDDYRPALPDAIQAVARKTGADVVLTQGFGPAAGEPRGDTPEAMLDSLLDERARVYSRWQQEAGVFTLVSVQASRAPETPRLDRARRALAGALPAEYGPFLGTDTRYRYYAARAPWARLWHSLDAEQRRQGKPYPASELSQEQQGWLYAALQAQTVEACWRVIEQALAGQVETAALSLDLRVLEGSGLGITRMLQLRYGDASLGSGTAEGQPPMLPMLPTRDPGLRPPADLKAEATPLSEVADQLSGILEAPVVIEDPERKVKLTGEFRQKRACLLLSWMERRTGLQWCKREGVYVLSAPNSLAPLFKDPEQILALLERDIPRTADSPAVNEAVIKSMTPEDQAAAAAGKAAFGQLSPGLQEAIRDRLYRDMQGSLGTLKGNWEFLNGLRGASLRIQVTRDPKDGRVLQRHVRLDVETAPGEKRGYVFPLPNEPQAGR